MRRWTPLAGWVAALGAGAAALSWRDPRLAGSWPSCPTAALGVWCPGCGAMRCGASLLDGDVAAAFSYNVLVPFAVALITWSLIARATGRGDGDPMSWRWSAVSVAAVVVTFTVVRNTPWGSALAP